MSNSDFNVSKLSLAYAKIVATPTGTGWSQVYNAGSLFTILSLTLNSDSIGAKDQLKPEEASLPAIGKDIFNNLEAEFFSLEEKKHHSIKSAIEKSFEKIPPGITADACLAYFKDNILYLFIFGKGKVIMKREGKLGLLLEKKDAAPHILSASGHLLQGDIILLQTDHFTQNVEEKNISSAFELQLPNDIADSLSPHVHEKEDGSQAAIIIAYNGAAKTYNPPQESTQPNKLLPLETDKELPESEIRTSSPLLLSFLNLIKKIRLPIRPLTKKQIISLGLGAVLLVLLVFSIIFTKKQQEDAKNNALYQQVYAQAQKNYDEGKSLAKLNQNLAQDDFAKAQQILKENLEKFPAGSKERTKLQSFLNQIESELAPVAAPVNKISPVSAEVGESDLLSVEKNNEALSYAQDDASVYLLTGKAVTTVDKTTGKKKDILLNNKDWTDAVALSPYQGNIYILDQKAGILKFVASQDGFGKTEYFKGTPPDLSKAQSLAIDGSIWILTQDGKILKYTKGEQDSFTVTGLDSPFKNPSKIATSRDINNIYVLDKGNARIIKLDKNGQFQNQYNAGILRNALDFEIPEKDQKALILSGGKTYSLPL